MKCIHQKSITHFFTHIPGPAGNMVPDKIFIPAFMSLIVLVISQAAIGQPSGGPYGPVRKAYTLPRIAGNIYYVAPDGSAEASGTKLSGPTTIESAMERVRTGDAIVMRGGTYRTGNLYLNQGIMIQPYQDERPVLKGTDVAADWTLQENGLWTIKWTRLFPTKPQDWWRRYREGARTPQHRFNNDMVFADGRFLQSAGWEGELDADSYYIDYETGLVYICFDPTDKLMEITAFDAAIIRTTKDVHSKTSDRKGPVIRGITFTQYANRALDIEGYYPQGLSGEADHGKDVIGTTLEHCEITFCSRVAGYFMGDSLIIRHCRISDTSTEGIYIISSSDVLLEKNIFTRNNIEKLTGYYPAAVKIFNQCYRATCNDNLIIDLPYSTGVWYDVGNVDGVFINNWVQNVGDNHSPFNMVKPYPSGNGFFFEISKGAVCANNVFVDCDHGVWALNSRDVQITQNTFVNSTVCVSRDERSAAADHFGWHPSTGPDVDERTGHVFVNNLLYGDADFDRLLLYTMQPVALCASITEPQFKELDYNVYVRAPGTSGYALVSWSPVKNKNCYNVFQSLEGIHKANPAFSGHSRNFPDYSGPLFKGLQVGNFQLLPSFEGSNMAKNLPPEITRLLDQKDGHIGAYPPLR